MKKIVITQKDKIILTVLLCFMIIAGTIFYIYMPSIKQQQKLKSNIAQLNTQIAQQQALIETSQVTQEQIDQIKADIKVLSSKLAGNHYSEQIEQKFSKLATSKGLDSETVSLTYDEQKIIKYTNSEATKSESSQSQTTNETLVEIPLYSISQRVGSQTYSNILSYINELEKMDNVVINSITFNQGGSSNSLSTSTNSNWTANLSITYYEYHYEK